MPWGPALAASARHAAVHQRQRSLAIHLTAELAFPFFSPPPRLSPLHSPTRFTISSLPQAMRAFSLPGQLG